MLPQTIISKILFPVPSATYAAEDFGKELVWIPKKGPAPRSWIGEPPVDLEHIPCLLLRYPSARFVIIYFHSNAEDLGLCRPFCQFLRDQFQVHVLAVEYPGYGICSGTPCPEGVTEHAHSAMYFAMEDLNWPWDSIKVMGRSIGTGPAMDLALNFSLAGLILISPFLSIQELFRDRIGSLASLVQDIFANNTKAPEIRCPTLIIHGQKDGIVSVEHGQQLFQLLKSRKLLVLPPDMEHNSNLLFNIQYFILPMFQFFSLPDYVFQDLSVPDWALDPERGNASHTRTWPIDSSSLPALLEAKLPERLRSALEAVGPVPELALSPPPPVRPMPGKDVLPEDALANSEQGAAHDAVGVPGSGGYFKNICAPMRLATCGLADPCCFSKQTSTLATLPTFSAKEARPPAPSDEELLAKPEPFVSTKPHRPSISSGAGADSEKSGGM